MDNKKSYVYLLTIKHGFTQKKNSREIDVSRGKRWIEKMKKLKKTKSLDFVEKENFGWFLRRWPIFCIDDFLSDGGNVSSLEEFISLLRHDLNSTILVSSTRAVDGEKVEFSGEYEPGCLANPYCGRPNCSYSLGERIVKVVKFDMATEFPIREYYTRAIPAEFEVKSAPISICFGNEKSLPNQKRKAEQKYEELRDQLGDARIGKNLKEIIVLEKELESLNKYINLLTSIGNDGAFVSYEYSASKKRDMTFCEKEALIIYIDVQTKRPATLESFITEIEKLIFMLKVENSFLKGNFSVIDFDNNSVSLLLESGERIKYYQSFNGCYVSENDYRIFNQVEGRDWLFGDKQSVKGLLDSFLIKTDNSASVWRYRLKEELKGIRFFSLRSGDTKIALFRKLKQAYYNIMLESLGERKIHNWNLLSQEEWFTLTQEIEKKKKILEYGESIYNLICTAKNLGFSPSSSRKIIRKFGHGKFVLSVMIELMKLGLKPEDTVLVTEKFPEQGSKNKQLKTLNIAAALVVVNGEYSKEVKKIFSEYLSLTWLF